MEFRGHTHIKVVGNALAPARMWSVMLYTADEYAALPEPEKSAVRELSGTDNHLLALHFGASPKE